MWSNVSVHGNEAELHQESAVLGTSAVFEVQDEHQGDRRNVAAN